MGYTQTRLSPHLRHLSALSDLCRSCGSERRRCRSCTQPSPSSVWDSPSGEWLCRCQSQSPCVCVQNVITLCIYGVPKQGANYGTELILAVGVATETCILHVKMFADIHVGVERKTWNISLLFLFFFHPYTCVHIDQQT